MLTDGQQLTRILQLVAHRIEQNKDYLCKVDSDVGDGDHGVSMTIGMRAARKNLKALDDPSPAQVFRAVSEAFADEVGASIGPLYEEAFEAAATVVESSGPIHDSGTWLSIFEAMVSAIQNVGKAKSGDKTLLDAWLPATEALQRCHNENRDLQACLEAATDAAWQGVEETKNLVPKLGRASRLGERARGHQDAGATSASIIIETLHSAFSSQ
jgi:dihydroxyacetone kinase-like protein